MTNLQSAHSRESGNPAPAERGPGSPPALGRANVSTGGHPSSRERRYRTLRIALPIVVLALGLLIWEAIVRIEDVPAYVLPAPGLILKTLVIDWALLGRSLLVTLATRSEERRVGQHRKERHDPGADEHGGLLWQIDQKKRRDGDDRRHLQDDGVRIKRIFHRPRLIEKNRETDAANGREQKALDRRGERDQKRPSKQGPIDDQRL